MTKLATKTVEIKSLKKQGLNSKDIVSILFLKVLNKKNKLDGG